MPDQMTIHCPSCSQEYHVSVTTAGHRARCTKCKTSFIIPQEATFDEDAILSWIADATPESKPAPKPVQPSPPVKPAKPEPPPQEGPRAQLLRIDDDGAHFEFSAASLPDEQLRDSFPRMCVGCHTTQKLRVHLLCWPERMVPEEASRWEELQNTPVAEWAKLWASADAGWMDALSMPWKASFPFSHPFPFFVCRECRPAYEIRGSVMARDTVEVCIVTIRDLGIAIEFCKNSGGRHTSGYHRLLEARELAAAGKGK